MVIRFFIYRGSKPPNTAFQSQREQPLPTLQKAFINSTSTAKLSKLWKLSQYKNPHWTE